MIVQDEVVVYGYQNEESPSPEAVPFDAETEVQGNQLEANMIDHFEGNKENEEPKC